MACANRITDIKHNSPAHTSGKIEDGDEIIQINYQTVVGWHYKRVLQQLQESPPDVILTLKKRPRHTKIYGQIYMKPYRLPSKKRTLPYRFGESLPPSPRIELIPSQNFPMLMPLAEKKNLSDCDSSSSSSSSILLPNETTKATEKDLRLYLPKPRAVLQRRNTICGDRASGFRGNITFWHKKSVQQNMGANSLRDKSVSFGFGLEETARPATCIGIHNVGNSYDKYGDLGNALKGSLPDMKTVNSDEKVKHTLPKLIANNVNEQNKKSYQYVADAMASGNVELEKQQLYAKSKVVKFNTTHDIIEQSNEKHVNVLDSIPYVDDDNNSNELNERYKVQKDDIKLDSTIAINEIPKLPIKPKTMNATKSCDSGLAEAINMTLIKKQHEKSTSEICSANNDDGMLILFLDFYQIIYFTN